MGEADRLFFVNHLSLFNHFFSSSIFFGRGTHFHQEGKFNTLIGAYQYSTMSANLCAEITFEGFFRCTRVQREENGMQPYNPRNRHSKEQDKHTDKSWENEPES